jgi:hypothetical protein
VFPSSLRTKISTEVLAIHRGFIVHSPWIHHHDLKSGEVLFESATRPRSPTQARRGGRRNGALIRGRSDRAYGHGTCSRSNAPALQKMNGKTAALQGGALATFEVEGERFRAWTTNPQTIQDLYALQQGTSRANIPSGRILRGPGRARHNAPYHWHLDPQDITMSEVAMELCDALPSYVEENVDEFVERVGRYCPWGAELVELRDFTGRAGQQFPTSGQ